ncbi:dihydroorotate oxidase B, electron transfer subunit [Pelagirhabdus alkalitolerans]|uniref:Dihydroorotate dehydrogenase B (NAD(+)), electron transfer subunit n=1 Tax=Pelagirhabdus alkalitolerans TaxID=1612202 RepID=A0A1G6H134_9BACI|nr:dihydroorotate dehydrogenase electron transfer subunit [Pelagirhabdus alkalitolerans]SDB87901.1 dihydroorotate oxidase B, electron transfer subunit [Pelagirhabdus alkalitolerans]
MQKLKATIRHSEIIARDTVQFDLLIDPTILKTIQPGQFVHVNIDDSSEHMLRRPISIADVKPDESLLTLIFKQFGEGTKKLAQLKAETPIDLLIPSGNGYPIDDLAIEHALLIGGGIGVPPLYYLAKKLKEKNVKVTTVIGFQSADDVFYEEAFLTLGDCFVATDDGSYGYEGFVTDVMDQNKIDFDMYFACGPNPMLRAVKYTLSDKEGYISLEERMGCGIGACYACVVPNRDETAYKKVCHDGPVFHTSEVSI